MSQDTFRNQREMGRLFRTIVIMGGSLALGCGGKTDVPDADGDTESTGGGAGSGGASNPGVGGAAGTGGSAEATGGAGTGGDDTSGGGSGGFGGDILDCPPEQWDCSEAYLTTKYGDGGELICTYVMPQDCMCDPSRPLHAEDCPSGTARACLAAGYDETGDSLDDVMPFACLCVPFDADAQYCGEACRAHGDQELWGEAACDETLPYINVLCGCELPILR